MTLVCLLMSFTDQASPSLLIGFLSSGSIKHIFHDISNTGLLDDDSLCASCSAHFCPVETRAGMVTVHMCHCTSAYDKTPRDVVCTVETLLGFV